MKRLEPRYSCGPVPSLVRSYATETNYLFPFR